MMPKFYLLFFGLLFSICSYAQQQHLPRIEGVDSLVVVQEPPEHRGGMQAFYTSVISSMKYPLSARRKGIEGIVYVQFVVNKEGKLEKARVLEGIDSKCDKEALQAVQRSSGKWKAGRHNGKLVNVVMVLPVIFNLDN